MQNVFRPLSTRRMQMRTMTGSPEGGLVYAYLLDGAGGGRTVGWQEFEAWRPTQGALWAHLDCTDRSVLGWLRERSGLDAITCEALCEKETRPRILAASNGLLLILRGVNFNPGSDPEDMVALRMWSDGQRVISMRHRRVRAIEDVAAALEDGCGPIAPAEVITMIAERITDRMGDVVSEVDDTMDDLEDRVLTVESRELRTGLGELRRRVIMLRRYIAPQRDALSRLFSERVSWLTDVHRLGLRETAERTVRCVEDLDAVRDRASVTSEELMGRLAEQTNRTMYLLSLVAAVFLPLGLLTGLLGINVGGIPGAEYGRAFLVVCALLAVIALGEIWWFRKKGWF